ncbi:MAG TPA: TonB-dependent receptor [Acidobacteriaceae bacterium]|nr:TonB-dependent receptor [Acidobacteriaceae bacterium]
MTQQRSWFKYLSLTFLVLCCANVMCFAQLDRGTISGIVTDPSGAVVSGAKVTATNTAMGTQSSTVTNDSGIYSIPALSAGSYSVTVVAPSFKELIRQGITVSVGQTATVNLQLSVGQATTSITVTANAPLLQTDSAQNNVEVTSRVMNELPFNIAGVGAIRDPMGFAALIPGTISGGWNDIHISGSPATTYRVFMDGLDDTSAVKGAISDEQQPSVESLASQSLLVNDYSAQYGEAGGGVFNYTSKSGTNRLHGSLFNYLENEDLDAGQPFNYTASGHKSLPVQRELDFGGSVGGPVVIPHLYNGHDKTFFFVSYEEYHNTQTLNNGTITVPTTAYRNGDLSSLLLGPIVDSNGNPVLDCLGRPMINGAVYDPSTTRTATCTDGSTAVVRDPFPNNFIGAPSTWDPVAQQVLTYMPTPSGATADQLTSNYPYLAPNNKYQYLTSVQLDQYIGQKWHLSAYYIAEYGDKDNADDGINGVGGQTRWNVTPAPQLYVNADYTATPNLVLHAGMDFTRHDALQDSTVQNFKATTLGLNTAANMPGGAAETFPIFDGLTVNNQGVPNMGINNAPFIDDNYYETGSAIWVHGRHTFEFGGDIRHQLFGTHNDLSAGTYNFSRNETSLPSAQGQNLYGATLGDGFASFVLGQLDSASIGNDNIQWFHRLESGFYALDTWKLTNKLTVNYGLRWDLEQMQHEQRNRETQFSPTVANPSAGGLLGGTEYEGNGTGRCNCSFEKFYPWMIQPRLGFSYQLDPKTVVHAASGFYSGPQLFMNEEGYSNQGFGFNQVTINSPSYGIAAGQLSNGVPYSPAALTATNFDPGAYPNIGQTNSPPPFIVPNNGRPPRFLQSTVGIEREIANNLTVNASFIDIRGVWLNSDGLTNTTNELTPSILSQKYGLDVTNPTDFNLLTQSISSPAVAARGFSAPYSTFPSGASLAQALRPFPQFGNIGDYYEHNGNWWYDALQIKVTKRLSNGLSGGLGYSWSKNLGTVSSTGTYTTAIPIQDPSLRPQSQKSYEAIDQPQMLNFYFNYEMPTFSFDQNGWKRALLSGWTADGIFHYQSGFPIQTPNSTSTLTSVTFGDGVWANRVPGQKLFLHNLNDHNVNPRTTFFLNPAAWTNPAPGTYATSKPYYGDYRGPRYPSEQLGFGKVIPIREGMRFELRADFFNVFNRWAYPNLNNTGNPFQAAQYGGDGSIVNGFGYLGDSITNAGGNYAPRSGEIVARFQF